MKMVALLVVVVLLAVVALLLVAGPGSAEEIVVHYHRPDADYDGWTLWAWVPGGTGGTEARASEIDGFGAVFRLDLGALGGAPARVGMLPKFRNWDAKDDPDRYWTPEMGREVYVVSADKQLHTSMPDTTPRIVRAFVDAPDRLRLVLSRSVPVEEIHADVVSVRAASGAYHAVAEAAPAGASAGKAKMIEVTLSQPLPEGGWKGGVALFGAFLPGRLEAGRLIDGYRTDLEMGAVRGPGRTVFRAFAPTADTVAVALYDAADGGEARLLPMAPKGNGVWEAAVEEDLAGRYYKFRASFGDVTYEVVDPYSYCNTGHDGRCLVVADATPVAPPPSFPPRDAVVYEMHIRDFTIDPASGVRHRGKYLGLTEDGTRLEGAPDVATGLDHLRELGVNVVQIMPFQDFDNDEAKDGHNEAYNWGYMPFHFNSPDGWFATRRDDASRVAEAKRMIDALHRAGMKVVMDVVYNHTAEGNPEVRMSFNGLAPNYYYRQKDDGSYWNGSGCGNEFRTEAPMARKYIVESLLHWVREYGIDGFRFDLMGLIDLETLDEVVRAVRAVKPDALIYGEPWAGGTTGIRVTTTGDQRGRGFGVFNADFRDALRGSVFSRDPGWLVDPAREPARVKRGLMGGVTTFAGDPVEAIQYIEAHDNHTLWDRLVRDGGALGLAEADLVRADLLGAAAVFTAQGIPFIHSGQEMLRTKDGEDNTYDDPDDLNQIHWRWKRDRPEVFAYYRGLIALRRAHPMFRQPGAEDVHRTMFFLDDHLDITSPPNAIGFVLNKGRTADSWENVLVLLNPNPEAVAFGIPAARWTPVVNDARAGTAPLGAPIEGEEIHVAPRSAMVLYNEDPGFFGRVLEPRIAAKIPRRVPLEVAAPDAARVHVAGTFNGWNNTKDALTRGADGLWRIELTLPPGTYEYKFLADGAWDTLNKDNRTLTVE